VHCVRGNHRGRIAQNTLSVSVFWKIPANTLSI
jgi:hypothetical protein